VSCPWLPLVFAGGGGQWLVLAMAAGGVFAPGSSVPPGPLLVPLDGLSGGGGGLVVGGGE